MGTTAHAIYRLSSNSNFSFLDLIQGKSLSPLQTGGQGAMVDFDLGATYAVPIFPYSGFKYNVGAAVNNVLGGGYSNLGLHPISSLTQLLPPNPGLWVLGFSITRDSWWKFSNTTFAFEATDMGNNTDGSFYRTLHFGQKPT